MSEHRIKVENLARVEGEGRLYLRVAGGRVTEAEFRIFEPPRFFEAFLGGRDFREAPDITARICGICPIAYQMSSCHAMENALGIRVDGMLRELRRLIYCGEWIESHVLHVYMLHAPDFLGYEDAIRMARDHPGVIERGLRLKKAGNEIVRVLGGREIHPVNVRVGGFYRAPRKKELHELIEPLRWAADAARETVRWTVGLPIPDFEQDYEFVSLSHPEEYPFCEGRIVSSEGLDIAVGEFGAHFEEEHVARSNALHCVRKGGGAYLVGPLARYNLNRDRLPPDVLSAAREAGLDAECRNPFRSIAVRAVEVLFAVEEALRIVEAYEEPERPFVEAEPRAGEGHGCTEAPRGSLYHRYRLAEDGTIEEAEIVPPTSQNQKRIEADLRRYVEGRLDLPTDKLQWQCEQVIRNYDPCISCATHFLDLEIERD